MEKQIETVYVPTDEAPYLVVKDVEKEFIKARVTEQQAYLYTPEEHAAVQGYREALEKIANEPFRYRWEGSPKQTPKQIAQQSLSKEVKEFTENGTPIIGWFEYDFVNKTEKFVTVEERKAALSKAEDKGDNLDELEYYQNARESFSNAVSNLDVQTRTACDSFILAFDRLLNHVSDIHAGNIKK